MSPQQGADLVGAGYTTSNAITALLGGTSNGAAPNTPVYSNLYLGSGVTTEVAGPGSAASGSVNTVAVPVTPGAIISKISWVVGGTAAASTNVANLWSALYTGTGSAPGTTGAAPTLISSVVTGSVNVASAALLTFTLATPQTITSIQAPYGYIYAAYSVTNTTGGGSPAAYGPSLISLSCASAAQYPWFATSPVSLLMTSNGATGASVPATLGTATRVANPPVVLLY